MGSKKLVGRGAQQMAAFHDIRKEFEARKTAQRYGSNNRSGAGGVHPSGVRTMLPRLPIAGSRTAGPPARGGGHNSAAFTGKSALGRVRHTLPGCMRFVCCVFSFGACTKGG